MTTFGPVPSRRLGRSLGINNMPEKICTYACRYCQLGKKDAMRTARQELYKPDRIVEDVERKVAHTLDAGEKIDYLTFVPNGEPTLDVNLGTEIERLIPLGFKIAVVTNASLAWREDVQNDLGRADCVSLKLDAVTHDIWRKINRPCRSLKIEEILRGLSDFSRAFSGELLLETMLVHGINDSFEELEKIAGFIAALKPVKCFLAVPTRPPACTGLRAADEQSMNTAYQLLLEKSVKAQYLTGFEGNAFSVTGEVEEGLLGITSVHPMREDSVRKYLERADAQWSIIEKLIEEKKLKEVTYREKRYYLRTIP